MKLRYYLRGLGIGIVVTAILMGVATKDNGQMTDAEIKERAAQLGMVEQKVLADITDNEKPVEDVLQPVVQPTVPPEVIEDSKTSEDTIEKTIGEQKDVTEPDTSQAPVETVQLTIRSGASSLAVSKDLAASGLVADAAEFDSYLSQGGYDKSICVGEFDIPVGATYEEIAKIITKRD